MEFLTRFDEVRVDFQIKSSILTISRIGGFVFCHQARAVFNRIEKERTVKILSVRIYLADDIMTAQLMGEIDHHSSRAIREEIDERAGRARPARLVMDFRDVTFMDSSGIGLVMGRYGLMKELEGELAVENMPEHIRKVMKLAGLDKLANMESRSAAR